MRRTTNMRELVLQLAEAIDADEWEDARRICHELKLDAGPRARWDSSSLATLFRTLGVLASDMLAQTNDPPLGPAPDEDEDDEPELDELDEPELDDELDDEPADNELELELEPERRQQVLRWSGR